MISSVNLRDLWSELDEYEKELTEESSKLEQAWHALCELDAENASAYETLSSAEELKFINADALVRLEVGGQLFVLPVELLTATDPFSLLAACCRLHPPFKSSASEESQPRSFFFDRDWWLFRHIVTFLRTKLLPNEIDILTELYTEACFYRLETLKKAIEDVPVSKIPPKLHIQAERYSS